MEKTKKKKARATRCPILSFCNLLLYDWRHSDPLVVIAACLLCPFVSHRSLRAVGTSRVIGTRDIWKRGWWRPYLSVVWVLSLSAQHSRRAGYCDFLYDDSNTYLFCGYGIWPIIFVKRQKSYSIEPCNIMYKRLSLLIKRRKKRLSLYRLIMLTCTMNK